MRGHLATSTFPSHGRHGTWRHPPSLRAAGVATSTLVLRGRCGTWCHLPSFCAAGVAPGDWVISTFVLRCRRCAAWQAWRFVTHNFVTTSLSRTTVTRTIFLCNTPSFTYNFVTHNSSHTTFLLLDPPPHPLSSFLPRPRYNICCSLLEEVDLWGHPVL